MNVRDRLKQEHLKNMRRIEIENLRKQYKEEEKNSVYRKKIKLPSTTKMIAAYLFIILNIVLFYAMFTMYHFADLSFLGVLITDIAAQILTFVIYAAKSAKENSKSGITYELAMLEKEKELEQYQFNDEDVSG